MSEKPLLRRAGGQYGLVSFKRLSSQGESEGVVMLGHLASKLKKVQDEIAYKTQQYEKVKQQVHECQLVKRQLSDKAQAQIAPESRTAALLNALKEQTTKVQPFAERKKIIKVDELDVESNKIIRQGTHLLQVKRTLQANIRALEQERARCQEDLATLQKAVLESLGNMTLE